MDKILGHSYDEMKKMDEEELELHNLIGYKYFGGTYVIYKSGVITNTKTGHNLVQYLRNGAYCVDVNRQCRKVARLLAYHFLGWTECSYFLRFKDGNRKNHSLGNLLVLKKESVYDEIEAGLKRCQAKSEIARELGIDRRLIEKVIKARQIHCKKRNI